ncbi:MAG: hypothetical protein QXM86_02260 [Candidatus Bathyarchaeia archaeon]
MVGLLTEIRTFYSLKEIRETVEAEINQYRLLLDDYSQWLGTLLRNPENSKNPEWVKKTAELQKLMKAGGKAGGKKEEKTMSTPTVWAEFKDIMLSVDAFGEIEILFEAVEKLKGKVERLEKVKNSILDLERYGLGKEIVYVVYINDGVPEKIVFKPRKTDVLEKFEYVAEFSAIRNFVFKPASQAEELTGEIQNSQ